MKTTDYAGINYASPTSDVNRDPKTKIRYGVISHADVGQAWYDESEAVYSDDLYCLECSTPIEIGLDTCPECETGLDDMFYHLEPLGFVYKDSEYCVEQSQDSPDLFVIKSPYFTYAQFCSPCAPGACYLANPLSDPIDDNRAYCLGPDWFDGEPPHPIYSVETGLLVSKKCIFCGANDDYATLNNGSVICGCQACPTCGGVGMHFENCEDRRESNK